MTTQRSRRTQKILISIRLRPETLAAYRATGKGWQTRISDALDHHVALARASPHAQKLVADLLGFDRAARPGRHQQVTHA